MTAQVIVFVVCAAACVVAHLVITASVLRSRSSVATAAVPRPNLLVEIVWAVVPAIALAFVLTATWARVRDATHTKPSAIMKVAQ